MTLIEILDREREAILAEAFEAMQNADLRHYAAAGERTSRARLEALLDAVRDAIVGRTLMPIETHAETVAQERFRAGFGLGEVQTAYNVLEEAVWRRIESELPKDDLAEALALVSTMMGAGKDHLARAYVSLATNRRVPTIDVKALFRGTSGA